MSAPRPLAPGETYLVTRRCTQRQFLLRPGEETNSIFLYALAFAAAQTAIQVHAFVQMSNHWHGVLTDPDGRLPEFRQIMHRLVACAVNAALGRVENLWSADQTSYVRLDHPDDVLDKLAYVIANPVAAGLVADPHEWPGMITTDLGEVHIAARPEVFFRANGNIPDHVTLACTLPPALRELGEEGAARRVRRLVRAAVQRATNKVRENGRAFLGAEAVRALSPFHTAVTPETMRKRRPTFASRDRARRLAARDRLHVFRRAYRLAFDRWHAGDHDVRFPEGTYLMRVQHGASCGPPPPS